ncbi:MAG TPA: copper amine oxidase N-terminal domain-containing protein [Firmicutes bacterium]|nr:copper amine oxidase N-terminal domain-containing protein [Bacillota bacterium]
MKRKSLAITILVLVLVFASSLAYAGRGITILINGVPLQSPIPPQEVNGTLLVPLRAVSEALGCQVNWNAATNTVTITKPTEQTPAAPMIPIAAQDVMARWSGSTKAPKIIGSQDFVSVMQQSLQLLAQKAPETFLNVQAFTPNIILKDMNNGFAACSTVAGTTIDKEYFYNARKYYTPNEVVAFYAAILAHEATHMQLSDVGLHNAISEDEREAICYLVEISTARKIGGVPSRELTYMQQQAKKFFNP